MNIHSVPRPARHVPENANRRHKAKIGLRDRIALAITTVVGTMYAVYFFGLFLAGWMFWQARVTQHPFDPYPFAFLLFLGNSVQLLLMPLIMVGQNIQARHSEIKADEEFKTTVTSFQDIEHILKRLDAQDTELLHQTKMLEELIAKKS